MDEEDKACVCQASFARGKNQWTLTLQPRFLKSAIRGADKQLVCLNEL